jgi:gamma-glutamyltranspeptidase/glutathione hydrolase
MDYRTIALVPILCLSLASAWSDEARFAGVVSSATPEATAAGVAVLEHGGNAVDAAIAVSLTLGVTEPAGSGIGGQTVMLIKRPGESALVIQGTTWSPRNIPENATQEQLRYGHTASSVPSTLRVLDVAHRSFGSGTMDWKKLVEPAIDYAENGFVVGRFRALAFGNSADALKRQPMARSIFIKDDGGNYQQGDRFRQPILANTLRRIAKAGAMDFYRGDIAREIVADVESNGGWITLDDLQSFPEPGIVPAISATYKSYDIETLPPPFAGWVVLQILNVLEQSEPRVLASDDSARRLALLDALAIGHSNRRADPVTDFNSYDDAVSRRIAKPAAVRMLNEYGGRRGGETTHFSIVDGDGMAVSVTQSIDSYFGAKVAHPTLGFLYNNYMQGFQVADPDTNYFLTEHEMPLSSMSATIVSKSGQPVLVLGSPASARIISAVAQVTSHWIDVGEGIDAAVSTYRVHAEPGNEAYIEGPEIQADLLAGMAERGFRVVRPNYGVSDSFLDPFYGGVHAVAFEDGAWTAGADPRRDGKNGIAERNPE